MVILLNDTKLSTLDQIREFLAGTADAAFTPASDDAARYRFICAVLGRFDYDRLRRADKGLLRSYLMRTSGYPASAHEPGGYR
jgi:hypothetical protein